MSTSAESQLTRFVVLIEARSGSTYLMESLNSHPKICAQKEILATLNKRIRLKEARPSDQEAYIQSLFRHKNNLEYEVVGFKTKLKDICDRDAFTDSMRNQHVRIILLQRHNRIKHLVSLINSMRLYGATGDWNLYDRSNRRSMMHIDVADFHDRLLLQEESRRNLINYADQLALPMLQLNYEEILTDPPTTIRRCCEFLGVQYQHLQGRCLKHTSDNLQEVIENYDELRSSFCGTAYQSMFDEVLI